MDVDVDARSVARDGDDGTSDARVAEALTRVTTVTTSTREGDAETRARAVRDALDALARSAPRVGAGTRWGGEACGRFVARARRWRETTTTTRDAEGRRQRREGRRGSRGVEP